MNPRRGLAASLAPCLALACAALFAALFAAPAAAAQPVPPPPQLATLPAAPAAAASPQAASAPAAAASANNAHVRVIEDDQVRIEELRDARGRLQRVTVHSKLGGKSYEIIVPPGGQDGSQARGTSGQAAWRLFDF